MNDSAKNATLVTMPSLLPAAFMSGPELYATRAAGYTPIGVVVGVSAMAMGGRGFGRSFRALFRRGEMSAISQTSFEARRRALLQAEQEAVKLGGDLILVHGWEVRDMGAIVEVACNATVLKKDGVFSPMPMATATS